MRTGWRRSRGASSREVRYATLSNGAGKSPEGSSQCLLLPRAVITILETIERNQCAPEAPVTASSPGLHACSGRGNMTTLLRDVPSDLPPETKLRDRRTQALLKGEQRNRVVQVRSFSDRA